MHISVNCVTKAINFLYTPCKRNVEITTDPSRGTPQTCPLQGMPAVCSQHPTADDQTHHSPPTLAELPSSDEASS